MPANDLRVDCRVQEVIFLGYLFTHPEDLPKYVTLLDEIKVFQSKEGQHIWGVSYQYYLKYGALPSGDVWHNVGFTEDEIDDLTIAVQELSGGSPDYKFMLDTFADTLQLAVYRNATEEFESTIQAGGERVLSKLKTIEDKMLSRLLVCRNADKSTMQGSLRGTLSSWFAGGLLFQQPKVAIPIKGMENVSGSPKGSVNLLVGGYGSGKFLPTSVTIPTPIGNRRWGDLKPGDYVFGVHGQPTKILQVFPQGLQDIYRVTFDDGSSLLCGKDHLHLVYGRKSRRYDQRRKWGKVSWRVMTTQEIIDEGVTLKHGKCQPLRQWEIPRIRPVDYLTTQELPVPAYVVGLWLGDGSASTGCLTLNSTHVTVIDYLKELYHQWDWGTDIKIRTESDKQVVNITLPNLRVGLRQLGILEKRAWEKYIPQCYLEASITDRIELFKGLMDSDGECDSTGATVVYTSSSKRLIDDVATLARGLGCKVSCYKPKVPHYVYKGERFTGRLSYRINIAVPDYIGCPFYSVPKRAERYKGVTEERYLIRWIDKIEKLDYQEECMCIKVEAEDGLHLANDFIPTHNTTTLSSMTAYLLHNYNVLYVTLETNADAIVFKILSNLTSGKVKAKSVHELPTSEKITSQELSALQAFKVAFDSIDVTREDEAVEVDLGEVGSTSRLKTLFHLTMSPGTATANQLELYVREIQRKTGLHIDTIMVDYAALMKTNAGGSKDDVGWSYTGTIMMELAAIAQNLGLVIWTAAQSGGQTAHTVMSTVATTFKPIRGADVYGSKEVLQNSSLVYGLSFVRSSKYPHLAVGVLSTLKNRYGTEFYDYICTMNYGLAQLQVVEIYDAYTSGDGGLIEKVYAILKNLELKYETQKYSRMSEAMVKGARKAQATAQVSDGGADSGDPNDVRIESVDVGAEESQVHIGVVTKEQQIAGSKAQAVEAGRVSLQNGVPIKQPRMKKPEDTAPVEPLRNTAEYDPPPITPSIEQREAKQAVRAVRVIDGVLNTASKQSKAQVASRVMGTKLGQSRSTDSPF